MVIIKLIYGFIIVLLFPLMMAAQEIKSYRIFNNLEVSKSDKTNSNNLKDIVNDVLLSKIQEGYFNSSIDSTRIINKNLEIYMKTGSLINVNEIKVNINDQLSLKLREDFVSQKKYFDPIEISSKIRKWIVLMNNNGFPFAEFEFKNYEIIDSKINLECNLISGPLVRIDSLINPEISKKELMLVSKIINIKNGDVFNLSEIYKISENIRKSVFLKEIKPPAYEFVDNFASVYTYVKTESKNSVNGLIGIQPSENEKIQFTGNVSLNFLNALSFGETLKLNWRKMFNSSQNLISEFSIPFIFKTNIEIMGGLDMIKKDSSFFNLNSKFILNYRLNSNLTSGFLFAKNNSTNLLQSNYSSTTVNSFGFTADLKKTNNKYNPSKGYLFKTELSYGWKQTYTNDTTSNNILRTPNFNGKLEIDTYWDIITRTTLKMKLTGSIIQNDILYENELIRIGGYKTIRGFNEESIMVSSFILSNFEFRYLLDEKSNVFIFSDFAWTESKTNEFLKEEYYQSFGFGTNISMKNGLLTFIYGIGRKLDNPFLIRTGKIHLGFTSYF